MADVASAADVKPDTVSDSVEKDQVASNDKDDGKSVASESEKNAGTNGGGPLSVFGGWGLPDINSVTEGIGGMLGEMVEGVEEDKEGASRSADAVDADSPESTGEDIQKAAAEAAAVATKELEKSAKVAQQTLGKAAEEIGKGWGSLNTFLDDMLTPGVAKSGDKSAKKDEDLAEDEDVQVRFRSLFPEIDDGEEVVDHYACTLIQKYRCFLNNATPEKTIPVRGRLFVTTSHLAMNVFDDGGAFDGAKFNVALPFEDVARVQKGAKSMMRVLTKSQSSYIFANFESETHFGGALSLVEMFLESSSKSATERGEQAGGAESGKSSGSETKTENGKPAIAGKKGSKATG